MIEAMILSGWIVLGIGVNILALLIFGIVAVWVENVLGQSFLGFCILLVWLWLFIAQFVYLLK